jgi:hypothetical protein
MEKRALIEYIDHLTRGGERVSYVGNLNIGGDFRVPHAHVLDVPAEDHRSNKRETKTQKE